MKITKKLRDVSYEEYVEWCRKCKLADCRVCIFDKVNCNIGSIRSWVENKDLYSDKFLDQTIEVEVPDILDKKEKEYLSAVIKPFRDKVIYIKKKVWETYKRKYITIGFRDTNAISNASLSFPDLPNDEMYKGMEGNRPYKLEELGL